VSVSRDIKTAFALMTVLPVSLSAEEPPTPRAAAWFPFVGIVLGGVVLALLSVLNSASFVTSDGGLLVRAAFPLAVLSVGLLALLTRFLHWDGLADVGDAWWGGATRERRLEIMSDSSIGAFGATSVVLVALLQVASVTVLLEHVGFGIAIFAAPVFARMAATFGAWLGTPARPGGLGASVIGPPRVLDMLVAGAALGIAAASMGYEHGTAGIIWSGFAFATCAIVPHLCALRFGGVTGDVLGASVVLTETILFLTAALVVIW